MTNVIAPMSIVIAGELARFHYAAVAGRLLLGTPPTMHKWAVARGYLAPVGEFDSALMIFVRMLDEAHLRAKQGVGSGEVVEHYDYDELAKYDFSDWDDFERKFAALAQGYPWNEAVTIEVKVDREAGSATVTYRVRAS